MTTPRDKTDDFDFDHAKRRGIEQQPDGSFKAVDKVAAVALVAQTPSPQSDGEKAPPAATRDEVREEISKGLQAARLTLDAYQSAPGHAPHEFVGTISLVKVRALIEAAETVLARFPQLSTLPSEALRGKDNAP